MPIVSAIQNVFFRSRIRLGLHGHVYLSHTKYNQPSFLPRLVTSQSQFPRVTTRSAASTVSNRPGSQTLPHAAQNIKEETQNSASDLAKTIAGNVPIPETIEPGRETFLGYTSLIASKVPSHILHMGLAGGIPYVGTGLASAYFARQAGEAATGVVNSIDPAVALTLLQDCLHLQVTYGAVLLSFTGALHWGMEMAGYNGFKGYPRVFLGAIPVIYGWSTLALDPVYALMAQWTGFTGMWYVDMKATSAGWTPKWYSQYRFYLSILVGTCIIGTLAATSYFGPTPGHDAVAHNLDIIRHKRRLGHGDFANEVRGPIEAVPAGMDADAYVRIRKKESKPEEQKE